MQIENQTMIATNTEPFLYIRLELGVADEFAVRFQKFIVFSDHVVENFLKLLLPPSNSISKQ